MSNFSILMNDPLAPKANIVTELPDVSSLPPFKVIGFKGIPAVAGTLENQENQIYILVANSLNFAKKIYQNSFTKWAATPVLQIVPRAGQQINAFYDRSSLKFYHYPHPETHKVIYLCESSDIVCHELGHAILDAIRPDLWNNPMIEIMAFHEAFSDINSMLSTLNYPEMADYIITETNGDLHKNNTLSFIAEQMGDLLATIKPNTGRSHSYLRNLLNEYSYVDSTALPNKANDDILSRSPHSYSQIFSGTIYRLLVAFYDANVANKMEKKDALIFAKDRVATTLFKSIEIAAITNRFFESIGKGMLSFMEKEEGKIAAKVFAERKIFDSEIIPLAASEEVDMANSSKIIKVKDYFNGNNPLYFMDVEIGTNACKNIDGVDEIEEIRHVKNGLDYLAETDKVEYNDECSEENIKEFKVENNKLVRNLCAFA